MRVLRYLALAAALAGFAAAEAQAQQRRPQNYRQPQQQAQRPTNVARRPSAPRQAPPQPGEKVKEEILTTIYSQVVIGGLTNPSGVAVRPNSDEVFIADSGAGQIVRLNDVPGQYELIPVITGFPREEYGKGPKYQIGPLGLCFLNKYTLVVGDGGQADGKDLVRVYRVPHAGTIAADETLQTLGPLQGEGNFFGIAATDRALWVTCNGAGSEGWLAKAPLTNFEPGELKPFTSTRDATKSNFPSAITVGRQGQLIVSQMGETSIPGDSLLTVYDPNNGRLLMNCTTGLHDIVALALSPQTGRIYALDFSWIAPEEGGLYRLDLARDGGELICQPTLLMQLDRPSAMAFAEDGTLFITTYGAHTGEHNGGLLVRVYNDSKL